MLNSDTQSQNERIDPSHINFFRSFDPIKTIKSIIDTKS